MVVAYLTGTRFVNCIFYHDGLLKSWDKIKQKKIITKIKKIDGDGCGVDGAKTGGRKAGHRGFDSWIVVRLE